ncbi:NAD(P)H-dependent oxidoreductase subunit E [candidate division KSB1 bacterium]|nr:NAD(P)H-dependent oxidoreductase subunit E [candidate division KSB1 bacterium]
MESDVIIDTIPRILEKHDGSRGGLISMLQDIQAKYGYLPVDALKIMAERTGRSLVDIYGVATFYKSFSLTPRGRHLASVCLGTACHVRGAPFIAEEFERQLGVSAGGTTSDKEFTLETVNCLGACALGPIVVIDGHYFSNVKTVKVKQILKKARAGLDKVEVKADKRIFPVEVSCPHCNHSLMDPSHLVDGYPSIRVTVSFGRKHGWLRLSSLYGSYNIESEYEIPMDTIVHNFCPHCHAELVRASSCPECGAPMVPMIVRGGGMVEICSRRGCKSHRLDLNGVNF